MLRGDAIATFQTFSVLSCGSLFLSCLYMLSETCWAGYLAQIKFMLGIFACSALCMNHGHTTTVSSLWVVVSQELNQVSR